jgi:hypothetical protein
MCIFGLAFNACIEHPMQYPVKFLMFIIAITDISDLPSIVKYALKHNYEVAYLIVTFNLRYLNLVPHITLFDILNSKMCIQEIKEEFHHV